MHAHPLPDLEFQATLEAADIALALLDERGRVLYATVALNQLLCAHEEIVLGAHVSAAFPELTDELIGRLSIRSLDTSEDAHLIKPEHPSGTSRMFEPHLTSWTTDAGQMRFTLVLRDVTSEQRLVDELRNTEERLDLALANSGVAVLDHDIPNRSVSVTDTWYKQLGLNQRDVSNPHFAWLSALDPDDLQKFAQQYESCLNGTFNRLYGEYRAKHRNGEWKWLRVEQYVASRNDAGTATRMVGSQIDITELKNASAAVHNSEAMFRAALEDAPIGMALVSADGKWLKTNMALCTFLGYEPANLLGHNFSHSINDFRPPNTDQVMSQLERLGERQFMRSDGTLVWGLLGKSDLIETDPDAPFYIVQIQDIDQQKQIEKIKAELISTVSHELRTPLTSIKGALGLLPTVLDEAVGHKSTDLMQIANANCERLMHLVDQILDLEQLTAGHMEFDMQPHNINEIVFEAVSNNHLYGADRAIKFDVKPLGIVRYIDVDAKKLAIVLSNLLSNAAKFSPEAGIVEVQITQSDTDISINIRDQGPGIPEHMRKDIFTRFFQGDSSNTRNAGGVGLGLCIAKELTEKMDGTIGFDSTEMLGSDFYVTFKKSDTKITPSVAC
jgi:PAS domain S-box-containing protein